MADAEVHNHNATTFFAAVSKTRELLQFPAKHDDAKPEDDRDSLKTLAMPEAMKKLDATAGGLTQADVLKRQAHYGLNQLEEK